METRTAAPLLLPAAAFLGGAALAWGVRVPPPAALALALLGLALARFPGRRRIGVAAAFVALGALSAAVPAAAQMPPDLDPERPVEVVGRVAEPWRWDGEAWRARLDVERVRRGARVDLPRRAVWIALPGEEEPPAPGAGLRVRGYLRRHAPPANGVPAEPSPWRLWVKSRRLLAVEAPPSHLGTASARWRRALFGGVEAALQASVEAAGQTSVQAPGRRSVGASAGAASSPPPALGAAFARALVLADVDALPPRLVRGLRRAGLGHLLAVSGLHLGLAAGAVHLLVSLLPGVAGTRAGRWLRFGATLATVLLYLLAAGPRPSLLRAAVGALVAALALALARPPSAAQALAVAALGLAAARPELVEDLGFRLTVAATAGVVLLAPRLAQWLGGGGETGGEGDALDDWEARRRRPSRLESVRRAVVTALAVTLAAQLATLPFTVAAFHHAAPAAPWLNLLAVPWTALLLAVALPWTLLAAASPGTAAALLPLLDALAAPFATPAGWAAGPWLVLPLRLRELHVAAAACGVAVASVWLVRARGRARGRGGARPLPVAPVLVLAVLALLAVAARPYLAVAWHALPWAEREAPELVVLDVGQGEAIVLQDGPQALLVDGGGWRRGDVGGRVLLPALTALGVRRLDAVVMTHPDTDHCRGLVDLGAYLPVAEVWMGRWEAEGCAGELAALPGARVRLVGAVLPGDGAEPRRVRLAHGRFELVVLSPRLGGGREASSNDRSLVLLAEVEGASVLLTGDVGAAVERRLLHEAPGALAADVLKLAHHGSKTSTGAAFLAAVDPRLALVSAGRHNVYGHPASEVTRRLEAAGVALRGTHRHGRLRLRFPGEGRIHLETAR